MPLRRKAPSPKRSTLPSPSLPPLQSGEFAAARRASEPAAAPLERDETGLLAWDDLELPPTTARACDAVRVEGEDGEGVVYLLDGEVAWVVARREGVALESLRARLVGPGTMSSAEFDAVLALCRADARNFCELIVALGLVEREPLRDAMRATMRDHLLALLAMPRPRVSWKRVTTKFTGDLTIPLENVLDPVEANRWRRLVGRKATSGSPLERHESTCITLRRSVEVDTVRGPLTMTTVDISEAGARIRSPEMLPIASRVTVHLNVAGESLVLAGRVVGFERANDRERLAIVVAWTELPPGMGETFTRLLANLY